MLIIHLPRRIHRTLASYIRCNLYAHYILRTKNIGSASEKNYVSINRTGWNGKYFRSEIKRDLPQNKKRTTYVRARLSFLITLWLLPIKLEHQDVNSSDQFRCWSSFEKAIFKKNTITFYWLPVSDEYYIVLNDTLSGLY